jgi:mannose-6-phosphate isomerase-like protein (cupin superfamily)
MPVFKSGKGEAPDWCEMEYFDIVRLSVGESHMYTRVGKKERLFIGSGRILFESGDDIIALKTGDYFDIPTRTNACSITATDEPATSIRVCGRWEDEMGGCGVFKLENSDKPKNDGDPVNYPRTTDFDCHYHDFDEYWIIFEGSGSVMSEQELYEVSAGDCVATRMGDHHDFQTVKEKVQAVYFETTLRGRKRLGHLWQHTHGKTKG